jgi:hypothetical protein
MKHDRFAVSRELSRVSRAPGSMNRHLPGIKRNLPSVYADGFSSVIEPIRVYADGKSSVAFKNLRKTDGKSAVSVPQVVDTVEKSSVTHAGTLDTERKSSVSNRRKVSTDGFSSVIDGRDVDTDAFSTVSGSRDGIHPPRLVSAELGPFARRRSVFPLKGPEFTFELLVLPVVRGDLENDARCGSDYRRSITRDDGRYVSHPARIGRDDHEIAGSESAKEFGTAA